MHTLDELKYRQAMPLDIKLAMTKTRIRECIKEYGQDGVYVSFSGGKDSTVLLDIVRQEFPRVRAMFVDVPTQFPELREFAKTFENVDIVQPKLNFMSVCEKYGFPLISKEVALCIYEEKRKRERGTQKETYRSRRLEGTAIDKKTGKLSQYNIPQWKFLLDAPFKISHMCCDTMKKHPAMAYEKETGKIPILAQMAEESFLRRQQWLKHGCNAFDLQRPKSNPMSFWTEQDVLLYIRQNNLPICSVYGEIVTEDESDGQMQLDVFEEKDQRFRCTGCQRTGCVLCGFGAHMPDDDRFIKLKESHPGMYRLLDVIKNNGYTMRQAIEWIAEHGNKRIKL